MRLRGGFAASVLTFALLQCQSAIAGVGAGAAQQPSTVTEAESEPETIVVTGSRLTRDAVRDFVGDITVETGDQIATFQQLICPVSFGLPEAYNRVVEQRIREVATAVGLQWGDVGCDPNLVVIVADDAGRMVSEIARKRPKLFAGLEVHQINQVLKGSGPVRTWQVIEERGSDGRPVERYAFLQIGNTFLTDVTLVRTHVQSRITKTIRPDLASSFVVLDLQAIDGLTLTQVADYAAMRALARTTPRPELGNRSIVGLLNLAPDRRAALDRLTSWDLAYLRALYRTSNTVSARSQKFSMVRVIERELGTSQADFSPHP